MTQPIRSWKQPLEPPREKGFFAQAADTISLTFRRIFNGERVDAETRTQIAEHRAKVAAARAWDLAQNPVHQPVKKEDDEDKGATDPIDHFFEEFFYNIVVSFFEAQLIEQVRNIISIGVSNILTKDATRVAEFLIKKMEALDIKDKNTKILINRAIDYYLGSHRTEEDRKKYIGEALAKCSISVTPELVERLEKECTVEKIMEELGEDKLGPFVQSLMQILLPKWLISERFQGHLNLSIYQNFKTLIDQFIKEAPDLTGEMAQFSDIGKISPMLKVVARIGSRLVGQRLTFFFKNMDIKGILDKGVKVARQHVEAHTTAYDVSKNEEDDGTRVNIYNTHFTQQEGCHPDAQRRLREKKVEDGVVKEFSNAFVDYILDDDTIKQFVESLALKRNKILKDVTNPFVIGLIDDLIKKENVEPLTKALVALKPLIKHGFMEAVYQIGFNNIFHRESIYRILYVYIAPVVADVIQRVMIKTLVFMEVNNNNEKFIESLGDIYVAYYNSNGKYDLSESNLVDYLTDMYINKVKSRQNDTIIKRLPDLIGLSLKEFMDAMMKKGLKPEDINNERIVNEIKDHFKDDNSDLRMKSYGELLMTLIFQLPKQNARIQLAKYIGVDKWDVLTNIFTSLFLNGVYDLRGVDSNGQPIPGLYPHKEFFKMIEPSIKPYEDGETVRQIFQNAVKPWDASTIKTETEREAKQFGDILYDLIRFSTPTLTAPVVDTLVGGLSHQLKFVLLQLFGRSEVNYNLFFHILEIFKNQIDVVQKAEAAAKSTHSVI